MDIDPKLQGAINLLFDNELHDQGHIISEGVDILACEVKKLWRELRGRMEEVESLELSRTELIKQNAALAAENERLEKLLGDYRHDLYYSSKDVEHYKAVIKAAQSPAYELNYQYDEGQEDPELGGDLIFHQLNAVDYPPGTLFYAGPVPSQSPQTRSSLPDNVTRVVDASTGRVKQSVTAVAVPDKMPDPDIPANPSQGDNSSFWMLKKKYSEGWNDCRASMLAAAPSHDRCPSHEPEAVNYNHTWAGKYLPEVMQAYGVQDSGVVDHD